VIIRFARLILALLPFCIAFCLPAPAPAADIPARRLKPLGGPTGNGALLELVLHAEHSGADCRLVLDMSNVSIANRLDRITLEFRSLNVERKEVASYELEVAEIKPKTTFNTFIPLKLPCETVTEVRLDEVTRCVVDDVERFDCLSYLRLRSPGRVKFER
jgi:hypothetical protein